MGKCEVQLHCVSARPHAEVSSEAPGVLHEKPSANKVKTTRILPLVSVLFLLSIGNAAAVRKHATLNWETGTVSSGLNVPLEPSFSINGKSPVVDSRGNMYVSNQLHNLSVVEATWAREGKHVLKVMGDGRNYGTSKTYAWRSELGAVQDEYTFVAGDEFWFTASFMPDESWDQISKYSTVITQFKMSPGHPHGALRLSNMGDYKLTYATTGLWTQETDEVGVVHCYPHCCPYTLSCLLWTVG